MKVDVVVVYLNVTLQMVVSAEAEHGQTILFHNGEYYIQTEQGALVLEGANEHFVITDDDSKYLTICFGIYITFTPL